MSGEHMLVTHVDLHSGSAVEQKEKEEVGTVTTVAGGTSCGILTAAG